MDCVFSVPVTFNQSGQPVPPMGTNQNFQFTKARCEVATGSATSNGIRDIMYLNYFLMVIVVLFLGWRFGTFIYRK